MAWTTIRGYFNVAWTPKADPALRESLPRPDMAGGPTSAPARLLWPAFARQQNQEQRPGNAAIDPALLSREQRTLSRFLRNLQVLWQNSQPHPEPKRKRRYTPRPRTLFAEHQPLIEQWLEEGTANAAEILRRLIRLAPENTTRDSCARWSGASGNGAPPAPSS